MALLKCGIWACQHQVWQWSFTISLERHLSWSNSFVQQCYLPRFWMTPMPMPMIWKNWINFWPVISFLFYQIQSPKCLSRSSKGYWKKRHHHRAVCRHRWQKQDLGRNCYWGGLWGVWLQIVKTHRICSNIPSVNRDGWLQHEPILCGGDWRRQGGQWRWRCCRGRNDWGLWNGYWRSRRMDTKPSIKFPYLHFVWLDVVFGQ